MNELKRVDCLYLPDGFEAYEDSRQWLIVDTIREKSFTVPKFEKYHTLDHFVVGECCTVGTGYMDTLFRQR